MKRVFGLCEGYFDILYLSGCLLIAVSLFLSADPGSIRMISGLAALVLGGGDAFHLVPRIAVIFGGHEEKFRRSMGRGKQITSITMTVFYLLLWHIGQSIFPLMLPRWETAVVYGLAAVRILLCLMPQNRWEDRFPPVNWGILRNIPFFLLGLMIAGTYWGYGRVVPGMSWMWLAILLSFLFYLPVVLWANKVPKVGMLMLPKTCAYLWMLCMLLSL